MDAGEIRGVRELFDSAEREPDPRRKCAALEEALDLIDGWLQDETGSPENRALVRNLRRSNARRLLVQLVSMRDVHFDVWFSYLSLLFFRLGPEVRVLLNEDEGVRTAYEAFLGLWGPEATRALLGILAEPSNPS
ncbi:MAG TPA: hypothetical protein VML56_10015 [Burkholderiales bacterium]|nr:hypothetical protein [Burkholderiales bacterium]